MNVKGTVKEVRETQVISEKFKKRDLILTDNSNEKYPQHLSIQFTQDNVKVLDGLKVGEEINISINLRGREWTSPQGEVKYFNTIEGWRIENLKGATETQAPQTFGDDSEDGLPF